MNLLKVLIALCLIVFGFLHFILGLRSGDVAYQALGIAQVAVAGNLVNSTNQ